MLGISFFLCYDIWTETDKIIHLDRNNNYLSKENGMKVYITGHRNPDLDSVCSAYAYAALKSKLDPDNEYIAVRCGHLSESCKSILAALEINVPPYMPNVFPKVSDVMIDADSHVDIDSPLKSLAGNYSDSNPSVVPIYENDKFTGLMSVDDIAAWLMKELSENEVPTHSPTIREVMRTPGQTLQTEDLFEEAKISLKASQKRGLAVFEGKEYKGFVTRRCFLHVPKYNVILVDHNEPKQSIKGIEEANILEIVDHHRLDAIKTTLPIFIDAEPLGSTCTIVYQLYLRNNVVPDKDVAKALLTGMISDTLILKSPTTTQIDVESAKALAGIIGVDIKEFGSEMFSHTQGLASTDPETAILADFKRYTEKGVSIGIGQCEVNSLHDLEEYKAAFLKALRGIRKKNGLDWAVVMITNVISENSVLLTTNYRSVKHLPYTQLEEGVLVMPGVMSRKKQLLPVMLYTLGM